MDEIEDENAITLNVDPATGEILQNPSSEFHEESIFNDALEH